MLKPKTVENKNSEPVSDTIDVEGKDPYHPSRYAISISDLLSKVNKSFVLIHSQIGPVLWGKNTQKEGHPSSE